MQATVEQLKGLPPALIQVAESDILRDEGEVYGRKLDEAGVTVTTVRYNGMIHDFGNAISDTDFTEDLKRIDVPTLFLHGDDDQVVPIANSSILSAKIVKGSTLKVYPGLPHGMYTTNKNLINEDLLAFLGR